MGLQYCGSVSIHALPPNGPQETIYHKEYITQLTVCKLETSGAFRQGLPRVAIHALPRNGPQETIWSKEVIKKPTPYNLEGAMRSARVCSPGLLHMPGVIPRRREVKSDSFCDAHSALREGGIAAMWWRLHNARRGKKN